MTQEEKAIRYDEAIERAIKLQENSNGMILKKWLLDIFPELRESENEKIRKEMIFYFQEEIPQCSIKEHADKMREFITWLEKKGEPKPKANAGDWLVHNERKHIVKIINHTPLDYEVVNHLGYCHTITKNAIENNYHLWTIQDAKDGDVLCCESGWTCIFKALDNHTNTFSSYCFMSSNKWFCNMGSECHTLDKAYNGEIYPATKEQRDLLFQKMKEAEYTFDFEKKELKKIEQKPTETEKVVKGNDREIPNSAWSEEDEKYLKLAIDNFQTLGNSFLTTWLKSLKERVQPKQEWSEKDTKIKDKIMDSLIYNIRLKVEDILDINDWFNYIKLQNRWKPSDVK